MASPLTQQLKVHVSNQGKIRQQNESDGLSFSLLCPRSESELFNGIHRGYLSFSV